MILAVFWTSTRMFGSIGPLWSSYRTRPTSPSWRLRSRPLDLIARKVGVVGWSLYGERALLARFSGAPVYGWVEAVGLGREASLLTAVAVLKQRHLPEAATIARCQSLAGVLSLARAAVGVAALPCLLGDRDQRLQRLPGATVERQPLWLLMAPENRRTRRVRVFADHLLEAVQARAEQISGLD